MKVMMVLRAERGKTWLRRYLLPEVVGTITALLAVGAAYEFGRSYVIAALVAPWGENVGYYGTLLVREVRASRVNANVSFFSALDRSLRVLTLEFGPAELFDSLLTRPFFMYLFPRLIGSLGIGIVVGKIAADFFFYLPVIATFELRRILEERKSEDVRPDNLNV